MTSLESQARDLTIQLVTAGLIGACEGDAGPLPELTKRLDAEFPEREKPPVFLRCSRKWRSSKASRWRCLRSRWIPTCRRSGE